MTDSTTTENKYTHMVIYDVYSEYWLKKHGIPTSLLPAIIRYKGNVLDLGCGGGRLAVSLVSNFTTICGIDLAANLIHKASLQHPTVRFVCGNFLCPKIWASFGIQFDLIISNCAIRKTANLAKLSDLCFQYLSPGGGIALRIQGIHDLAEILPASIRQFTFYNQEEIREVFGGFSNLSIGVEQYHQRFSSEEYLRNFLKKIDVPFDGRVNRLTPTRHYYIVTGERI